MIENRIFPNLKLPKFEVATRCITFNHASYILDALHGFTMQKTDFPFLTIVIDDASTDGEQEVIEKYMKEEFFIGSNNWAECWENELSRFIYARHPLNKQCYFIVMLLKRNLHKEFEKKKSLYYPWIDLCEYRAECEGDDYWTDPNKLQQQVDFLESHPEYSMCCCRARMFSLKNSQFRRKDNYCRKGNGILDPNEIIRRGGFYIPTCSIIYRRELSDSKYPEYCRKSPVSDYSLQIWLSMKGKVYYYDSPMAVYRVDNPSSWSGKKDALNNYSDKDLDAFRRQIDMLKGFAKDYPKYKSALYGRIEFFINSKYKGCDPNSSTNRKVIEYFKDDIRQFSFLGKIDMRMRLSNSTYISVWYYRTLFKLLFSRYLDKFW